MKSSTECFACVQIPSQRTGFESDVGRDGQFIWIPNLQLGDTFRIQKDHLVPPNFVKKTGAP